MLCPQDQTTLVMSERAGVEIDYCPSCRGVWLDRGELDKILDRGARELPPVVEMPSSPSQPHREGHKGEGQKKKRKNWLGEIFELGE